MAFIAFFFSSLLVIYTDNFAELETSFKYTIGIIYRHLSYRLNIYVLENGCTRAEPTLKHIILFILKNKV
jgi:hypothetical protein